MRIKVVKHIDGTYSVAREGRDGFWEDWLPMEGDNPLRCFVHAVEAARRERLIEQERQCEDLTEGFVMDI